MPQVYIKDSVFSGVAEEIGSVDKGKVVAQIEDAVKDWLLERNTKE